MLIKKNVAKIKNITNSSIVYEYPDHSKDLGLAVSEINGRFPEKGVMINKICNEIYFVIDGQGEIEYQNNRYVLEKGDLFFIEKDTTFCVKGSGLKLFLITTPAFFPEQWENLK